MLRGGVLLNLCHNSCAARACMAGWQGPRAVLALCRKAAAVLMRGAARRVAEGDAHLLTKCFEAARCLHRLQPPDARTPCAAADTLPFC